MIKWTCACKWTYIIASTEIVSANITGSLIPVTNEYEVYQTGKNDYTVAQVRKGQIPHPIAIVHSKKAARKAIEEDKASKTERQWWEYPTVNVDE